MIYQEKQYSRRHWQVFWALAILLYLPGLGTPRLNEAEAIVATIASQEHFTTVDPVITAADDAVIGVYPLQPFLVRLLSLPLGRVTAWTVRLPSLVAIIVLAWAAGRAARRAFGDVEALVAATGVLAAALAVLAGRIGDGRAVFACLIATAWLTWYTRGRLLKHWAPAWAIALSLVLLAAFHSGPIAFLLFYFPLFFLRRPHRVWPRLLSATHLTMLGTAVTIFLVWRHHAGVETFLSIPAAAELVGVRLAEGSTRWVRPILFPVLSIALVLPLSLFAWASYCAAFVPLEKHPASSRFLRTLILPVFVAACFMPRLRWQMILPLLAPFAVLSSVHYQIVVRRHHRKFAGIMRFLRVLILVAGSALAIVAGLHGVGLLVLEGLGFASWATSTAMVVGTIFTIYRLDRRSDPLAAPIYLRVVIAISAIHILLIAALNPWIRIINGARHNAGYLLELQVPDDVTVYKLTAHPLTAELFYADHPVEIVRNAAELPTEPPVVYVLADARPPILETRTWIPVSPPCDIQTRLLPKLELHGLKWPLATVKFVATEPQSDRSTIVRTYKGRRRSRDQVPPGVAPSP